MLYVHSDREIRFRRLISTALLPVQLFFSFPFYNFYHPFRMEIDMRARTR